MINNSNNKVALKFAIQNLFIMHFFLTILKLFSIFSVVINQVGSPLVDSNDVNTSKTNSKKNIVVIARETSGRKNTVVVEFDIRNKKTEEPKKGINSNVKNEKTRKPNRDAKIGLKVQPKRDAKVDSKI